VSFVSPRLTSLALEPHGIAAARCHPDVFGGLGPMERGRECFKSEHRTTQAADARRKPSARPRDRLLQWEISGMGRNKHDSRGETSRSEAPLIARTITSEKESATSKLSRSPLE
jgi:hypothetical protein